MAGRWMVWVWCGLLLGSVPLMAAECDYYRLPLAVTSPTESFALAGDGTATELASGLVWMRCSLGQSWDLNSGACQGPARMFDLAELRDAIQRINQQGFAGHADWRLPRIDELEAIIEQACWRPAINGRVFPNTAAGWYWSSSQDVRDSGRYWLAAFSYGGSAASLQHGRFMARLVRGD